MALSAETAERNHVEKRAIAFSNLGKQLSAARTQKEAAAIMIEAADALFQWDACLFDILAADQKTVHSVICMDTINGRRQEIASGALSGELSPLAARALEAGQLILRDPHVPASPEHIPFGDKSRPSASIMYVPIRKDEKVLGLLSLQSYTPDSYTRDDLSALEALADHCGGALERIRAEQENERLNQELRLRLEELQTVFRVAPVGIAVAHDPQCRVITGNPAFTSLLGVAPLANVSFDGPEAAQLPFKILRGGKSVPVSELPMHIAARKGVTVRDQEFEIVFGDGRVIHTYLSASPLYDDSGHVRGSLGVLIDLTERKRAEAEVLRLNEDLERRVKERTAQLEAINKELEAFSYSVSHDLRAPLRSIRGFSEVLLERYCKQLDPTGQEFLKRACQSSQQMETLIEDLLKLSRVSRSELQRQQVNLSRIAESIAADLRKSDPQRAVEFVIEPGLQACGDERLLRVALDNLLRNAWKFTSKQPRAKIEVGSSNGPPQAFFVRDNGAGFDMTYSNRLFGVFQRLHTVSEFPGTGVGLATVQRIISRHGGRVWAIGEVNRGATFYFTLPPNEYFWSETEHASGDMAPSAQKQTGEPMSTHQDT
jgi:signal transduction histidine kinase